MPKKSKPRKQAAAKRKSPPKAIIAVPTLAESKNPSSNLIPPEDQHYFTAITGKTVRQPQGEISPKFREEDGNKYLIENSANTATFVRFGYPPLEYEARYAMEWAQQTREKKNDVSVEAIYEKCPRIKTIANRTEVDELVRSYPGHPDSRKWAIGVLARALQKPQETISKYARTDPPKK